MPEKKRWFTCQASQTTTGVAEVSIYDEIGYWGMNAADFRDELAALGEGITQINLRVNSPGGEVFDGIAIYNMLKRHPAHVVATVDGLAASIASLVLMSGDVVEMPENSMIMIHNPAGMVMGTAADMRDVADALDKIRQSIVTSYVTKTGLDDKAVNALMDAETWLTAQEALTKGFADKVLAPVRTTNRFNLTKFRHAPRNVVTASEWVVGARDDLDVSDGAWDAAAATERMLDAAGFNDDAPDPGKAKQGFLVWDHHNSNMKGAYKLPFADVVDGDLVAVADGVRDAAQQLPDFGGLTQATRDEAQQVLDTYEPQLAEGNQEDMTTNSGGTTSGGTTSAVASGGTTESGTTTPVNSGGTTESATTATGGTTAVNNGGTTAAAATVADPVVEERDRCAQISAACEIAGYAEKAPTYIDQGKSLGEVLSELRGLPPRNRAGGRGATSRSNDEVSGRNNPGEQAAAGWDNVIARKNAQIR
jgi:ATP-dependent Clp endopeptidase proteolytic subunit ClpP